MSVMKLSEESLVSDLTMGGYNALRALNGGYKVQSGTVSVTITSAGTAVTTSVSFPTAFNSAPLVFVTPTQITGGSSGYLELIAQSAISTGFSLAGNSFVAETISVNWVAIGS